jgi:hypothetical protein
VGLFFVQDDGMKVQIKNRQIGLMEKAILALDKPDVGWDVDPKTRYAMARNLKKLREHSELLEKVRMDSIKGYLAPGKVELEGEGLRTFVEKYNELMEQTSEVDVFQVSFEDMNTKVNKTALDSIAMLIGTVITEAA